MVGVLRQSRASAGVVSATCAGQVSGTRRRSPPPVSTPRVGPTLDSLPLFPHRVLSIVSQRVYYVREDILWQRDERVSGQLVSLGVCVGKFTHSD